MESGSSFGCVIEMQCLFPVTIHMSSDLEMKNDDDNDDDNDETTTPIIHRNTTEDVDDNNNRDDIDRMCEIIESIPNDRIVLLRNKQVLQWILGDCSFLDTEKEEYLSMKTKGAKEKEGKILEDQWGQEMCKKRRPDLKLDKQWTNKFGEHICEEIHILLGKTISKPKKKSHYQPDLEIEDAIIETKTQTYYTNGTAGEKILGCPFKYAEIPELYNKPLHIVCLGGAEKLSVDQYGNLEGKKCSFIKKKYLDFFRQNGIQFIGASQLLKRLLIRS